MGKIGDGKPMAGMQSAAGGLGVGFTGQKAKTPKVSTGYSIAKSNQPKGKGKIPGGNNNSYVAHGAAVTPVGKKSATVGKPLAGGSVSGKNAATPKSSPKFDPLGANNMRKSGAMQKVIQKKASITGQSQTIIKAPAKQPKASGVPVNAPQTNWHKKLGFS